LIGSEFNRAGRESRRHL